MNRKRRTGLARRAREILGTDADIRYVIPTWTPSPARNWIVAVTPDEFIVFSVDVFFRPAAADRRAPRALLNPRRSGRKHVVWIGAEQHYVPFFHLNEVNAQNREFTARRDRAT
jgi:hypothetical protein